MAAQGLVRATVVAVVGAGVAAPQFQNRDADHIAADHLQEQVIVGRGGGVPISFARGRWRDGQREPRVDERGDVGGGVAGTTLPRDGEKPAASPQGNDGRFQSFGVELEFASDARGPTNNLDADAAGTRFTIAAGQLQDGKRRRVVEIIVGVDARPSVAKREADAVELPRLIRQARRGERVPGAGVVRFRRVAGRLILHLRPAVIPPLVAPVRPTAFGFQCVGDACHADG